jgi:hypothetical protein
LKSGIKNSRRDDEMYRFQLKKINKKKEKEAKRKEIRKNDLK